MGIPERLLFLSGRGAVVRSEALSHRCEEEDDSERSASKRKHSSLVFYLLLWLCDNSYFLENYEQGDSWWHSDGRPYETHTIVTSENILLRVHESILSTSELPATV